MTAEVLLLPSVMAVSGAGLIVVQRDRGMWTILHESSGPARRFPLASFTVERFANVAAQAIASELGTGVLLEGASS